MVGGGEGSPEQIKKIISSLSDKGSTTVKLHTEPFPRPTSKEVYEACTDELPFASSTASIVFAMNQQSL